MWLLILCPAAFAAEPVAPPQADLFSLSVHADTVGHDKALDATMRETERSADSSEVELEVVSEGKGQGRSAGLFLVRGFCGLMLARGQALAVAEQTSEHPIRFHVVFPKAPPPETGANGVPRMVLDQSQCAGLRAGAATAP